MYVVSVLVFKRPYLGPFPFHDLAPKRLDGSRVRLILSSGTQLNCSPSHGTSRKLSRLSRRPLLPE